MEEKKILAIQFELYYLQMAHDCLKDEQRKTILKLLEGNQCFISLPTGYGKSLIFQVIPFVIEYYRRYEDIPPTSFNECSTIVLVIIPLLALMEEQCKVLNEKDVASAYVGTYNHYINIAVLPHSKPSSLLDPPLPVSLSKRRRV